MEPNKLQHTAVDTSKKPVEFGDGRVAPNLENLKLDVAKDKIVKSLSNMVTILDGLSCWSGVFAFDELAEQIMVLVGQLIQFMKFFTIIPVNIRLNDHSIFTKKCL